MANPSGSERPAPEALLAHGEFVRRLARKLVGDGAAAEDLVQDAWLVALQRPPRGAVRPWLAAVVRNLARTRARDGDRLRGRELRARTPEPGPSAEEVLAREEVRARVVRAVLALPAPSRRALLLRYYEELSPRAIAHRLDLPLETVRTHLKRGLVQLRAKLDGEGRDWRRALLPIAFAPPMLGGTPLVAPLAVGLSLAGVAAAVLCCVLLLGGPERAVREPVTLVAAATVRVPEAAEGASDLVQPEAPASKLVVATEPLPALEPPAEPVPEAPAFTGIRGRVVDEFDVPVAHALVFFGEVGRLRGPDPFGAFDAYAVRNGVRTAADGTFELEGAGAEITAWNEAFSAVTVKRADLAPAPSAPDGEEGCVLRLPAPGRISGALPEFVKGARRGARLALDRELELWLDRHLGFEIDFVPAGLHGLQLPDGSLLGLRVRAGETTVVAPGAFLRDVEIEQRVASRSSRRRAEREILLVGLDDVFSVPDVRARDNVLSTPLLVAGRYVLAAREGILDQVHVHAPKTRAMLRLGEVALRTRESPPAVLVPAEVDEPAQLLIASWLAQHVHERSRKTSFDAMHGVYDVVRFVERDDLPPVLVRLGGVEVRSHGSNLAWREE